MDMYCETYRCSLSFRACRMRYAAAMAWKKEDKSTYGFSAYCQFGGCRNCEQGRIVFEKGDFMEEKNMETKVCPQCGRELPADYDHYYKDGKSKTGLSSWCRDCQRMHVGKYDKKKGRAKQKKTGNGYDNPEKPGNGPDEQADAGHQGRDLTLVLDLSEYEDLHADILAAAEEEFRTPEMQVLWWLHTRDRYTGQKTGQVSS